MPKADTQTGIARCAADVAALADAAGTIVGTIANLACSDEGIPDDTFDAGVLLIVVKQRLRLVARLLNETAVEAERKEAAYWLGFTHRPRVVEALREEVGGE